MPFDFTAPVPTRRDWTVQAPIEQGGQIQALMLWFDLQLDATTHLSCAPGSRLHHWNPVVFLFDTERTVTPGETVALRCRMGDMVFHFWFE